jgi:hypothetical protein
MFHFMLDPLVAVAMLSLGDPASTASLHTLNLLPAGLELLITPMLTAVILWMIQYVNARGLKAQLANIALAAEITTKELEASKESDKVQAVKVEQIAALSVQTHEAVNSGRTKLEEAMTAQRVQFESQIASLRSELHLAQVVAATTAATSAAVTAVQAQQVPPLVADAPSLIQP